MRVKSHLYMEFAMPATLEEKSLVVYPESDGKPVAETDWHIFEIFALLSALGLHFEDDPDVYVAANNFIYYEEGNPKARFSPDVYVVFGVEKKQRSSYFTWECGGRMPSVVFELTSRSSKVYDLGGKKKMCEKFKISEYFLFDALGEYLNPPLQGYRLMNGAYVPIERDAQGHMFSETLNLKMFINEQNQLRLMDPKTGSILLRGSEYKKSLKVEAQRARAEAQKAKAEAQRANAAEAEVARLKEELIRLKNKP